MDQIDVIDQKGNITNFGTRFLLALDTSSLRANQCSIESRLFHVKNTHDIAHKFVLKVDKRKDKPANINYQLKIQFFCHMDDAAHNDMKFFVVLCDKYGKMIYEVGLVSVSQYLMSEACFENYNFKCSDRPLVLHLYVFHHIPMFVKSSNTTDIGESACFSGGKFNPMNDCKFLTDISKLYMNSDLGDFKILTKDKTFNVHKVVLAARSTIFAEIFKKNENNKATEQCKNDSELTIDVSTNIVEEMLRYIYTNSVDNLDEHAIEFYEIGKEYNLAGLQEKCVANFTKKISVDNCMNLFHFAQKHNIESLYEKVLTFFTKNTSEVLSNEATDEFLKSFYDLELSLENCDLLQE